MPQFYPLVVLVCDDCCQLGFPDFLPTKSLRLVEANRREDIVGLNVVMIAPWCDSHHPLYRYAEASLRSGGFTFRPDTA